MPVKSEKQRRFMYASLAGKTDVPPSVAKKFVGPKAHKADGGAVKEPEMMKKSMPPAAKKAMEMRHAAAFKKAGMPKMAKEEMKEAKGYAKGGGIESKGKTKGKMVKMAYGGKAC